MSGDSPKKKLSRKIREALSSGKNRAIIRRNLYESRVRAHRWRANVVRKKGYTVVSKGTLSKIKKYARGRFGSAGYWPWLAAYTEVREDFIEGWIGDDFFSEYINPRLNPLEIRKISKKKTLQSRLLRGYCVPGLFSRVNGCFYADDGAPISEDEALSAITNDLEYVVKPDDGSGGRGLVFVKGFEVNRELEKTGGDVQVQEKIEQHKVMARLNASSVNTIRIITYLDSDRGAIFNLSSRVRIGRRDSKTDNTSSGGLFVGICQKGKTDGVIRWDDCTVCGATHPDTGVNVQRMVIPNHSRAVDLAKEAHWHMPYLRLIGWDIIVPPDGEPKIIEWNADKIRWTRDEALYGPLLPSY